MKVLANDGISQSGVDALQKAGFEVITTKVAQEQLANFINENEVSAILVRSAKMHDMELASTVKAIGRAGAVDEVVHDVGAVEEHARLIKLV